VSAERHELLLELAGMITGNDHMAFLMPLDVARKRVPYDADSLFGLAALAPFGEDDFRLDRHGRFRDPAITLAFGIAELGVEFHLRCAGMAPSGAFDLRPPYAQFGLQLVQGRAPDGEIAVGLRNVGGRGRQGCQAEQASCEEDAVHGLSLIAKACFSPCRDAMEIAAVPGMSGAQTAILRDGR
jgi:hypothetical protein